MSDNVERAIGRVEGTLEAFTAAHTAAQKRQTDLTDKLFKKLDEVGDDLVAVRAELKTLGGRIESVEGPVKEFAKWKERATGAAMLISMASAALGAVSLAGWNWLAMRLGL